MGRRKRRGVSWMLIAAVTGTSLLAPTRREASADEPVTTTIIAVATVASAIGTLVMVWDSIFGSAEQKACTKVTIKRLYANGDVEVVSVIKYSESPQSVQVPDDFRDLDPAPGYDFTETLDFDAGDDQVMNIRYHADYRANVLDPEFAGAAVGYEVERVTYWRYRRPPADPGGAYRLEIPLAVKNLVASTTDIPGTLGKSSWHLKVEAEELGGTLFETTVEVVQGETPVIRGDIPAPAFSLTAGRAELRDYAARLSLPVSAEVETITMRVTLTNRGQGRYTPFRRGDVNSDARFNLADAVHGLRYLFARGPTPTCMDAADSNDSGSLDLSDGIYLLGYLFQAGPEPPPAFSSCGPDATPDDPLGCRAHAPCES